MTCVTKHQKGIVYFLERRLPHRIDEISYIPSYIPVILHQRMYYTLSISTKCFSVLKLLTLLRHQSTSLWWFLGVQKRTILVKRHKGRWTRKELGRKVRTCSRQTIVSSNNAVSNRTSIPSNSIEHTLWVLTRRWQFSVSSWYRSHIVLLSYRREPEWRSRGELHYLVRWNCHSSGTLFHPARLEALVFLFDGMFWWNSKETIV